MCLHSSVIQSQWPVSSLAPHLASDTLSCPLSQSYFPPFLPFLHPSSAERDRGAEKRDQSSLLPPSWNCPPDPSFPRALPLDKEISSLGEREKGGGSVFQSGEAVRRGCPLVARKTGRMCKRVTQEPQLRHLLVVWGGGTPGTPSHLELQTLGETWPRKAD